MTDIRRVAILCAVIVVSFAALAGAQATSQSGPMDRALFRGDQRDLDSRQVVLLSASFSEAYDDNLFAESPVQRQASGSGFYSLGDVGLSYRRRSDRASFSADGGLSAVYYPDLSDHGYTSYRAGIDAGRQVRRTQLSAYTNAYWLPYFLFGGFPAFIDDETLRPNDPGLNFSQDLAVTSTPAITFAVGGRASHPISRRVTLDLFYDFRINNTDNVGYSDQTEQGGGGRVSFQVTRNTSLLTEYTYRAAEYERGEAIDPLFGSTYQTHEIRGGVEHSRPLSQSRALRLRATAGLSINDREALVEVGRQDYYYRGIGSASLDYDFSRNWTARVEADRSLQYLQGFLRPYFVTGVSASLGGLLTTRLALILTGRYAHSPVATEAVETGYNSSVASARLQYGLTRNLAVNGEYVYYQYDFGRDAIPPPGFVRELQRQVVRVGVTFGVPLFRQR